MSVVKKIKTFSFDDRGEIIDIFSKEPKEHCTIVTFKKNAVRGNHFHKKTAQYTFIVDGKIEYFSKKKSKKKTIKTILKKGDLILAKPNEIHAFKTLSKNSLMLAFSVGIRGGKDYEKDTFRVKSILPK